MTPRHEALIHRALTMIARRTGTIGGRASLPVAMEQMGARLRMTDDGYEVRLAGIGATSATGRVEAVTAWQRAARRELDRARAGDDA